MTYARRKDANSKAIEDALRRCGWHVQDTSGLRGFVDLVCARRGRLELVEVKVKAGKLKPGQVDLHAAFLRAGVTVKVLRDVEDAIRL